MHHYPLATPGDAGQKVVSLGSLCLTATLLQSMDLKGESYPFDWIFSHPVMVADCLDNDFFVLLDRKQYIPAEGNATCCYHRVYSQMMWRDVPIFNHHNPSNEADYSYFERCVDRFRLRLQAPNDLFLLIQQAEPDTSEKFSAVASAMRRRAPNVAMRFLAFYQDEPRADHVDVHMTDGRCEMLTVATRSLLNWGTRFHDPADDELMKLIIRTEAAKVMA